MSSHADYPRRALDLVRLPTQLISHVHILTPPCNDCSSVCGHSFSAAAIREYLGPNKFTKKGCPSSGCNQAFSQNDLKVDKELGKKVKDAARRERMREDDSDGEVIE